MSRIIRAIIQKSLHQNRNREEINNREIRYLPDLSIFNLLSVYVMVRRILNYYPNHPTHRLYFREVETPYSEWQKPPFLGLREKIVRWFSLLLDQTVTLAECKGVENSKSVLVGDHFLWFFLFGLLTTWKCGSSEKMVLFKSRESLLTFLWRLNRMQDVSRNVLLL